MESTNILRSGGLSGGPTTEMASIGGGSSEAVSRSGASSAFDLNVGIDLGDEGGVHGSDVSKGAKRKLIDLNEDAVDEDVESLKKGKGFDLNVELKEVEEVATAETETDVSVVQPPPEKVKLPPSSAILDLRGASFSEFISVYVFFRCFSTVLFLSPFEVAEFAASVVCNESTPLFDAIHLSLMRAVRRYTSAFDSIRSLNWDVLDSITWPVFLVEYLSLPQPKHIPGLDLSESSPLRTDYYSIPTSVKVAVLQHLCDNLVETEVYKSELSKRVTMEESGDWKMKHLSSKGKKKVGKRSASASSSSSGDDGCFLCKMGGNNLIFCDSCPAAMHTRCVGVVTSKLPKGDWHCPECRLGQGNYYNLPNSTREPQLLGTDHHARLYYQVCHYLLVVEQNLGAADECSLRVYKRDDLAAVVAALDESSCVLHERISRAITEHWNILSHQVQRMTTTTLRARSTQGCRASSSTKASYKKNLYEFAGMASVISEEMSSVATATRSSERIIAQQLKLIRGGKPGLFSWSNAYHLNVYLNNKKEKCGWCFGCNNDRDCLFVTSDLIQSSDVLVGARSRKGQTTDRDDDMDNISSIESRLQAFLQDTRSNPTSPENMAALNKLLVEVPITIEVVVLLRLCLIAYAYIPQINGGINWLFSEIKSKKEAPARSKMAEEVCNFTFAGAAVETLITCLRPLQATASELPPPMLAASAGSPLKLPDHPKIFVDSI